MKNKILIVFLICINVSINAINIGKTGEDKIVLDNVISNEHLTVVFDVTTNSLAITSKTTSKVFIKNLEVDGIIKSHAKKAIVNAIFGKGEELVLNADNGKSFAFTVYKNLPFIFITQTIRNTKKEEVEIQSSKPLKFFIDLEKKANEIRTLGTGGLMEANKNPGSYVFLTTVNPLNRNGVVTGWLTHEKGSGVVFSNVKNDLVEIVPQIDYGRLILPAGKEEKTETLVIGYFDDARIGQEMFADLLAKQHNIKLKKRSAVYCTWYSEKNGGAGSEESAFALSNYIKENLQSFGLGVIQIDDQWQDGGNYNGPARGFDRVRKIEAKGAAINGTNTNGFPAGFPNGMTKTASEINKCGLTAGIWWMPFARNHQDPEYKDRQDWFAYRLNGKPYETTWGGTSLDLTNPKVQEHVSGIAKLMQGWGYNYFKMDGLWTGTVTEQVYINDGYKNDSIGNCKPLFDKTKTQIEAFRNGLKLIRKTTNNQVFLSGCCISQNMRSFGSSIGLVDAMRIGPDYNHDGQTIRTGPLRASRLYFLNGRIWWNDPDPSVIREKGGSTADPSCSGIGSLVRARLLPSFVAVSGQLFLSSDWLPDLPNDRIEIMKRCMASHTGTARPVDGFNKELPSIWVASDAKTGTERNIIGLYNWETTTQTIKTTTTWAGLNGKTDYYAFDFWENKPINDIQTEISEELPAESCRVIAVRAKTNHPVVVSTSQHITQGMIDLLEENWKDGVLSGTSTIIGGDDYELRIAGLNDGGTWEFNKAIIKNNANVTIESLPQTEKGWLRIIIKSKDTQNVNWQINFLKGK